MSQDLDQIVLLIVSILGVMFALPFALAWLEDPTCMDVGRPFRALRRAARRRTAGAVDLARGLGTEPVEPAVDPLRRG